MAIRTIPEDIRADGFSLNALKSAPSLMALFANSVFATRLAIFLIMFREINPYICDSITKHEYLAYSITGNFSYRQGVK
jgi:hypothetical protein